MLNNYYPEVEDILECCRIDFLDCCWGMMLLHWMARGCHKAWCGSADRHHKTLGKLTKWSKLPSHHL